MQDRIELLRISQNKFGDKRRIQIQKYFAPPIFIHFLYLWFSPINTPVEQQMKGSPQKLKSRVSFSSSFFPNLFVFFIVFIFTLKKSWRKEKALYWVGDRLNKRSFFFLSISLLFNLCFFYFSFIKFMQSLNTMLNSTIIMCN